MKKTDFNSADIREGYTLVIRNLIRQNAYGRRAA
jgi:hypothetical protein